MKKPTIYEIKRLLKLENGSDSHFFDRKTLKFFGQTMKDFSVSTTDDQDLFRVCYQLNGYNKSAFFRRYWSISDCNVRYVDRYVREHKVD